MGGEKKKKELWKELFLKQLEMLPINYLELHDILYFVLILKKKYDANAFFYTRNTKRIYIAQNKNTKDWQ